MPAARLRGRSWLAGVAVLGVATVALAAPALRPPAAAQGYEAACPEQRPPSSWQYIPELDFPRPPVAEVLREQHTLPSGMTVTSDIVEVRWEAGTAQRLCIWVAVKLPGDANYRSAASFSTPNPLGLRWLPAGKPGTYCLLLFPIGAYYVSGWQRGAPEEVCAEVAVPYAGPARDERLPGTDLLAGGAAGMLLGLIVAAAVARRASAGQR